MMYLRRYFVAALVAIIMTACAGTSPLGMNEQVTVMNSNSMPAPTRMDLAANSRPYLIGPFDKLHIDVFGIEDLSKEVQIDASGRLSFPLVGVMEASGSTPDELAREIENRLRGSYIRYPQVTVNLLETVSQVITVEGEVDKPGLYPVVGKMTLVRAVANAGGTGDFAKLNEVLIFREVSGQRILGVYNLKAIRQGNYLDPEVYANDVIIVGDSAQKRAFQGFIQLAPLLTTPLILLLRK